jgi:hypothetical protein
MMKEYYGFDHILCHLKVLIYVNSTGDNYFPWEEGSVVLFR